MQSNSSLIGSGGRCGRRVLVGVAVGCCVLPWAQAQNYVVPQDVVVAPTENASKEAVDLSVKRGALRIGSVDIFPHVVGNVTYDDNLTIRHTNAMSDVVFGLSPGLTLALGDVAASLPGSVSLDQLRGLLSSSLLPNASMPQRFLAIDYTPSLYHFADHSEYDVTDHSARLSAGYAFSRLATDLDQDYIQATLKDNGIGARVTTMTYNTVWRNHYEVSDLTSFDVNGRYLRYDYRTAQYQGYQEYRNEDFLNRQFLSRITGSVGGAVGYVEPDRSVHQVYEQGLLRGAYKVTGTFDVNANLGMEWREYGAGLGTTGPLPVFAVAGVYQPWYTTTFTLEGHRREQPSNLSSYNYIITGFSAGARQLLFGRVYAGVSLGFDNYDYQQVGKSGSQFRNDDYYWVQSSVDYQFNPHWSTSVFYIYREDASSQTQYTYSNNQVGLQIRWQY